MDEHVGLIKLIPGTGADQLRFLVELCNGIIIESFGVGGLPEYDDYFGVVSDAVQRGKLIVMSTQVQSEGSDLAVYQVGGRLKDHLRVLEAYDMTTEAAVAKLMWILGQTRELDKAAELFYAPVARDIIYFEEE